MVSHWIYSSPPRCHVKFIPLPLKSVSLPEREGLWEHKLADGMEVLRVPFIRVWYDTNGIIAGWARVEPDQCEMIITGWSSQNLTTAFQQQRRMMGSLLCLWRTFLLVHLLNAKLHRKPVLYTINPNILYLSFKAAALQHALHMCTAVNPRNCLWKWVWAVIAEWILHGQC